MSVAAQGHPHTPAVMGVYIHLPWCVRKCPYCDFNSHVAGATLPQRAYVAALLKDLQTSAGTLEKRRVGSIFIGGGTPSLFDGPSIRSILTTVREHLDVVAGAEITLEANPGTVEAGRFESFREAGVNRLSLGAQSFSDSALNVLGRIHSAAEIEAALQTARAAGFTNINLDLMYGLPNQSIDEAVADVDRAVQSGVPHLSHYQLTLEPDTHFYRYPPELPDEETLVAMEERCQSRIEAAGMERYEVSAYARPGFQAAHNLNYWRFGDYLGLGAGAHSKLTAAGKVRRCMRRRNPTSYMRHAGSEAAVVERRELSAADLAFEFMLNRLRLLAPFSDLEFETATGLAFATVQPTLEKLQATGLMARTRAVWLVTPRGRELLNDVMGHFLSEGPDLCTSAPQGIDKCASSLRKL